MSTISNTIKNSTLALLRPRITEKATFAAGAKNPAYTFEVPAAATKSEVAKAVFAKYQLKPVRVNIVKLPAKRVIVRGRRGVKPAVKKAIVFLKPGEKIES